jgi:hypothetical protein
MTVFLTIITGVTVFVGGQIVLKWLIEPIQELRKIIAEVLFYLANDHNIIHNANMIDKEDALSTCKNLRRLGANLLSIQQLIPIYEVSYRVFHLPKQEDIEHASKRLSLMSNSIFGKEPDIHYRLDLYRIAICEALGIEDPIKDGMSKQELKDAIRDIRAAK